MAQTEEKKVPYIYQYFWIKIASKQEVERQRAESLGSDQERFSRPQTTSIHPPDVWGRTLTAGSQVQTLWINIGVRVDLTEAEKHGLLVEFRLLTPGTKLEQAEQWIKTDEGAAWAGKAYCFLSYAVVEIVPAAA